MTPFWETVFDANDYLHNSAFKAFSKEFAGHVNFTVGQMRIVRGVEKLTRRQPEGVSLRLVAEFLGTTPGATSTAVDQLVKKGMLERTQNLNDRRGVHIILTKKIKTIIEQIGVGFDRQFSQVLDDLSKQEQEICLKACNLFIKKMNQMNEVE